MRAEMVLAFAISTLFIACSQPTEAQVTFQYSVRGTGDAVVSYRPASGPLIEEEVTLPWSSAEYERPSGFKALLGAEASEGSVVECVVRHHDEGRDYDGNGAGELTQSNGPEDRNICTLEQEIRQVLP